MFTKLLDNAKDLLFSSAQKQIVGIALTPGLGLEAVVYDKKKNVVVNYGRKRVDYNFSTREIQDYMQFKTALSELMQQMEIMPKSLAYVSIPNIYFDFVDVPVTIADEEIKTAVLSKAEEFYLFKKEEPASGWCEVLNRNENDTEQKRIAYASIQSNVVDELKEIFADVGLQLVGIEGAYSTTIRGLYISGLLDDIILERSTWAAMVININSFTMFYFDTKNLLDCTEVPIAIKSFSPDEAYSAIASNASQLLSNFKASRLYIISQTDDLGAEVLKGQMQFDREIVTIDASKYSQKPIVDVIQAIDFAQANSMSLAALGAACIKTDFNLTMNILADDPEANMGIYFTKEIFGVTVDFTSDLILRMTIVIGVALAIFFGLFIGLFFLADQSGQNIISQNTHEITRVKDQINAETNTDDKKEEIDMNAVIDEVSKMNVEAVKFFDSIASDIPKDIWLTKYYNQDGDKLVIQGVADNIVDIYEYFKNLKITSPQSDIKLNTLRVLTEDNEENKEFFKGIEVDKNNSRLYIFEISNTALGYESMFESVSQGNGPGGKGGNGGNKAGYSNDNDIIINGVAVEQLSPQVVPASAPPQAPAQ